MPTVGAYSSSSHIRLNFSTPQPITFSTRRNYALVPQGSLNFFRSSIPSFHGTWEYLLFVPRQWKCPSTPEHCASSLCTRTHVQPATESDVCECAERGLVTMEMHPGPVPAHAILTLKYHGAQTVHVSFCHLLGLQWSGLTTQGVKSKFLCH